MAISDRRHPFSPSHERSSKKYMGVLLYEVEGTICSQGPNQNF